MADRFSNLYAVLFDASSSYPVSTKSKKLLYDIGQSEGMANVGNGRDEVLRVDKEVFCSELKGLMASYAELDAFGFFKLVHKAYDKAINALTQKRLIFYHIHNPDAYAKLNFLRSAPESRWIMMVREPIQSCESWIRNKFSEDDYAAAAANVVSMLLEIDEVIYAQAGSVGVRLEDLKEHPQKTIPA